MTIIEELTKMPIWQDSKIELVPNQGLISFRKGNVIITIPEVEVLIFGAKKVLDMFTVLEQ